MSYSDRISEEVDKAVQREKSARRKAVLYTLLPIVVAILLVVWTGRYLFLAREDIRVAERRVAELQDEIAKKHRAVDDLSRKVDEKRKEFDQLKINVEKLYSVRVTPANEVYELKATAKAIGLKSASGMPIYDFTIYVNAAPDVLNKIHKVIYTFDHPTFHDKHHVAESAKSHFQTGYQGWGCLTQVGVEIELVGGNKTHLDFNMCKSLGPQWQ